MRYAAEVRARPGSQKSWSTTLTAPIGGLNARDSVSSMKPEDAVTLENWFPRTTSVSVRNGFQAWSTFVGVCQTIMVYTSALATKVFPCVKSGSTYTILNGTTAGVTYVAEVGGTGPTVQALTSARFDYVNYGTTGGQFLVAVNGGDAPLKYDGTTWAALGASGGSSTPADFFTVATYQRRLFFGVKNSLAVYYNVIDTLAGAGLVKLDLSSLFGLGGYLNSIITVNDASNGLVAYIGFLSSEGEIVAFSGSDPSDASNWALAAHFRIGRPVIKGNRCWCAWGSDALVLCADGVYPLRNAIADQSRRNSGLAVSDKIRGLINNDIQLHGARFGWQVLVHPTGGKLIVNVPTAEDSASYQYVMNTQTGAWCKFTGWPAFSFETARDTLYMGMSGKMVKADAGADDGGMAINWNAQQAFNYLGSRGQVKHIKALRPILETNGEFRVAVGINADYTTAAPAIQRVMGAGSADPWGGAWDGTWSGATQRISPFFGVSGIGKAIAPHLAGQSNGVELSWAASDIIYERGGLL